MVWVSGTYEFASTFSYRIPYFSSSYALTTLAPSPSTIKLAIVASIINRKGNIKDGKILFEGIRTAEVLMELPTKISVFKV
ncbi:type I-A CRISPR-associated protein Cas5, partial [Candidatus Bathyarchaeota archaeon]